MVTFDTRVVLQAGHISGRHARPKMYICHQVLSLAWWCNRSAECYLALGPDTL